jgi:hypothetical protein
MAGYCVVCHTLPPHCVPHVKALLLFALRLHYHVMCYRTGGTTALVFMNIEIPAVPFWLLVFRHAYYTLYLYIVPFIMRTAPS